MPSFGAFGQLECSPPISNYPSCCSYDKDCNFNCHQYVRGCAMGLVDLVTRVPFDDDDLCALNSGQIKNGNDFIKVCHSYQSDAANMTTVDHSTYKVGSPFPYFATPNGSSYMLCSGNATTGSGSTQSQPYDNFAYIGDVEILGETDLAVGSTYSYTLLNLPSAVTIDQVTVNGSYASVEETNPTNFKIKALNPISNLEVKVFFETDCSGSAVRTKSIRVNITSNGGDPCAGTLNGGSLYTFNSVSSNSNSVIMNAGYWSWQLISGSASYTSGSQSLNFHMYSRCVSFRGYRSGCGSRTFTFCKGYYREGANEEEGQTIEIYDIRSGRKLKSIECNPCYQTNTELVEDLPFGLYIISRDGIATKHAKIF